VEGQLRSGNIKYHLIEPFRMWLGDMSREGKHLFFLKKKKNLKSSRKKKIERRFFTWRQRAEAGSSSS
jgi:hypothetical protein